MAADDVERLRPEETTTHPEAIEVEAAAAGATTRATDVVVHDGDENDDAFIRAARGLAPWTDDYFDDKIRRDGDDVLAVFEFNRYQIVAHALMAQCFLLVLPALIALGMTMMTMGFAIDRGNVSPWAIISMMLALLVAAGQLHLMWTKLQVLLYGSHLAVTRRGVAYAVEPEQSACFARPNSRRADLKVLERTVRMDFARCWMFLHGCFCKKEEERTAMCDTHQSFIIFSRFNAHQFLFEHINGCTIDYQRPCWRRICCWGGGGVVPSIELRAEAVLVFADNFRGSSQANGPFLFRRFHRSEHLVIVGLKDPQGFYSLVHKVKELDAGQVRMVTPVPFRTSFATW